MNLSKHTSFTEDTSNTWSYYLHLPFCPINGIWHMPQYKIRFNTLCFVHIVHYSRSIFRSKSWLGIQIVLSVPKTSKHKHSKKKRPFMSLSYLPFLSLTKICLQKHLILTNLTHHHLPYFMVSHLNYLKQYKISQSRSNVASNKVLSLHNQPSPDHHLLMLNWVGRNLFLTLLKIYGMFTFFILFVHNKFVLITH